MKKFYSLAFIAAAFFGCTAEGVHTGNPESVQWSKDGTVYCRTDIGCMEVTADVCSASGGREVGSCNEESSSSSNGITTPSSSSLGIISDIIPLTSGQWSNGNIASAGSEVLYSFNVSSGASYYVWWNDSYDGDNAQTLDVKVSAYYSEDDTIIFSDVDDGWDTPRSFTANRNGTVYISVASYYSGDTGTFGVAYSTTNTRP